MASRSVIELTNKEAKQFFKKSDSYVNFELPPYINFDNLLTLCSASLIRNNLSELCKTDDLPQNFENVNYTILTNKDGAYSWRPLEVIHPILYCNLVNLITEKDNWKKITDRFKEYSSSYVKCISIPRESLDIESDKAAQISNWWENLEQESLRLGLEYNYILATDITDCYGSLYTHSLEWALDRDGKEGAKRRKKLKRKSNGLGARIDKCLMGLNAGQTNGIPQGSGLMDFIAEIVLGYVDTELSKIIDSSPELDPATFTILRYRDDYRILTNDPNAGHQLLKQLNIVLQSMGFKMSPSKTSESNDVIISSVKKEKLNVIYNAPSNQSFQKEALRIYQLSKEYPNAGIVSKELSTYYKRINKKSIIKAKADLIVLISIFTMISVRSPKTIHLTSAISSRLLEYVESEDYRKIVTKQIVKKFEAIPNSGLVDIWLQRISAPMGLAVGYEDIFTKVVAGELKNTDLWNSDWLNASTKRLINSVNISNLPERIESKTITPVIEREEFDLYKDSY